MKRVTAAYNVASLKDRESIPQLIRLLNDPYCTYFMQYQYPGLKDGRYRNFPVQLDSGHSLVRLLGRASIPHLERKLDLRDPIMYDYWCEMIAEAGGPGALHVFDRLLKSGKRVQEWYITQVLDKDDGTFARDHKDLVQKLKREAARR